MPDLVPLTRKQALEQMLVRDQDRLTDLQITEEFLQAQLFSKQITGSDKQVKMMLGETQGQINAMKGKIEFLKRKLSEV